METRGHTSRGRRAVWRIPTVLAVVGLATAWIAGDLPDASAKNPKKGRVTGVTGACPDKGSATFGFAYPIPIDLFGTYEDAVRQEAAKAGHEVISVTGPNPPDPAKQVSDVNSLIDRGVDVLVVSPIIPAAMQPAIERAEAEGIPVVGIDIGEDALDQYATSITSDNLESARAAAEYMGTLIGEGGTVAILNGPEFAGRPLIDRAEGFQEGAEEAGLEVVDTQIDPTISPEGGAEIANGWKQQFPDLDGVLVFGDPVGLGVQSAVDDAWDPAIISLNGEVAAVDAVEAGSLAATLDIVPVALGYAQVYAAEQAFCGEELPAELKVDAVQVDESNVGDWVRPKKQLKRPFKFKLEERDGDTFVDVPDGFVFASSN